jgi:hypothetical protein
MIQVVNFNAIQNQDDDPSVMKMGEHILARNGKFIGTPGKYRLQNIPGNQLIPNTFLPATGTNTCIGGMYDQVKNRLIWANCNSLGVHALYIMDVATKTISRLIMDGFNTVGDPLAFTTSGMILSWNIVYGDATQGDVLFFPNSQKQPCQVNIDRALAGGYGPIQRKFIDVIRNPPDIPPQVIYQDDATVTVNNLRKKLFLFKYRFIFDNKDKSVWSAYSEVALPLEPFNQTIDTDPTKNCSIPIVFQTGDSNVLKIEIAGAVSLGATFSDFFSIIVLTKADLSIPNNDTSVYLFYNDKAYVTVDATESILEFDDCPLQVNAQELLNGNVLFYGGVKKGYNNLKTINAPVSSTTQPQTIPTNKFYMFFATQNGQSCFGTGNIHIVVYGNVNESALFSVTMADATVISFTSALSDTTTNVINGLAASATSQGFTVISNDANNLIIFKLNAQLALIGSTTVTSTTLLNSSYDAYDWWGRYSFGIQYFDANYNPTGRPVGGVQANQAMSLQTIAYQLLATVPQLQVINLSIFHAPPPDAYYYHIVRSKNLVENNFIYWISDRTIKDNQAGPDNFKYAYISIANLNNFVKNNPSSPLGYTFLVNDRIRFVKRYNTDRSTANIYTNKDFEIIASIANPTVNGIAYIGQFIKIILPATDPTFDFGSAPFNNYFIKLYTPAQPVANGLDTYYEFSKRFAIINPGTSNAAHQGDTQNQNIGTGAPALIVSRKGDDYFRFRNISVGNELDYTVNANQTDTNQFVIGAQLTSESFNSTDYFVNPNVVQLHISSTAWRTSDAQCIIREIAATTTFLVSGNLLVTPNENTSQPLIIRMYIISNDGHSFENIIILFNAGVPGVNGSPISVSFNTTVTLTTGQRMFILLNNAAGSDSYTIVSGNYKIVEDILITEGCIDPNFSDYYQSSVNSNGRPWIIDPNALQAYFGNVTQWGLAYDPDTNINQISRFYPANFDEIQLDKGDILRFKARERICRIFQSRGVGQVGVYAKFIQDSKGQNTLTTTDAIITQNNVQYYEGEYGLGNHPESLVSGKIQDYFVDPVRGYQIRLSGDGMIPISELYKGQYTIRGLLTPFNKTWNRTDGGIAKILGAYNYLDEEYICVLQSGTNGLLSIPVNTFSFNETRNAYCSYYDFTDCDFIISAEETIYSWKNGQIYSHDNPTFCNFYGSQFGISISVPINTNLIEGKTWEALSQISNLPWHVPLLTTNAFSYGTQQQETNLVALDFVQLEHKWQAAFFRDIHSLGGQFNGDSMKGSSGVITFQVASAFGFVYLSEFAVHYLDSALTVK